MFSVNDPRKLLIFVGSGPGGRWFESTRPDQILQRLKDKTSGQERVMRKEGERLIVEPVPPKSLLSVLATLTPLDEEFPEISDPRPRAVEL